MDIKDAECGDNFASIWGTILEDQGQGQEDQFICANQGITSLIRDTPTGPIPVNAKEAEAFEAFQHCWPIVYPTSRSP